MLQLSVTAGLGGRLIAHICEKVKRTCGCCGALSASPCRPSFDGPTRRVCNRCRDRLREGEKFLTIAEPLSKGQLVALVRRWPALLSLPALCEHLGYTVHIPAESYTRAARVVTFGRDDATARTAGGWLVAALRRSLNNALAAGETTEIVVAPDSLPIPPRTTRPRPDEPPDPPGPWDAIILTRR